VNTGTTCIDVLIGGWRDNLELAERLFRTISDEQMTAQPDGVVNHPAWTLAHLIHYYPAILSLAEGREILDPGKHPDAPRYDAGSAPVDDPSEYPSRSELLTRYRRGHEDVERALVGADLVLLERPPGLARWAQGFGSTARALGYLMVFHEADHLGQLAAWRRAMGWPPLDA